METIYYIYHIPTYVWKDGKVGKVGTTEKLKVRINENLKTSKQPFDFWEVLEEHTDIMEASRRALMNSDFERSGISSNGYLTMLYLL